MFGAESLYPPYFCDASQKPGKMARARPRIGAERDGRRSVVQAERQAARSARAYDRYGYTASADGAGRDG
ncbi:hypothetical protein WS45_09805 [Burkholderia sp. RF2-non_BP3]|nr:hypothetical protein WS45_09805 [Burkholderia sp. RF2-non_BP3]